MNGSNLIDETAAFLGERFGREIDRVQATAVAKVYEKLRPHKAAGDVARALANLPAIDWPFEETETSRLEAMVELVGHLDAGYWCSTLEQDGAPKN